MLLPTPRACEERLRGLADPREIKGHLPCPGRGACIEDGTPVRLHCPWRGQLGDNSYNGRKKIHLHADGRRPLARRPRAWPRKGRGRRPCMAMPPPPLVRPDGSRPA